MTSDELHFAQTALLAALPYDALRRIGDFLGVGLRGEARNRKEEWVAAIAAHWSDPVEVRRCCQHASAAFRSAYDRLRRTSELPAALFLAEYGGLRSLSELVPPHSVAEQLFLSGLLHAAEGGVPLPAARLRVLPLPGLAPMDEAPASSVSFQLDPRQPLFDFVQMLCFWLQQREPRLLQGRWLRPNSARQLYARLRPQEAWVSLRSHKQSPILRTLWFLARHANLIAPEVTTLGWRWLELSTDEQLAMLWEAWLQDGNDERERSAYLQPDAGWGIAARRALAACMARFSHPFTPQMLADAWLVEPGLPVAFFITHFHTLSDVERSLRLLLETVFPLLGVVAPLDAEHFALTDVGHQLLAQNRLLLSSSAWSSGEAAAAEWSPSEDDQSLTLRFAWCASPLAQARIALFSEDLPTMHGAAPQNAATDAEEDASASVSSLVRFTPESMAAAAVQGHGLAHLWHALNLLGLPLHTEEIARLHAWWEAGDQVTATLLPILRTRRPEQLAQLVQDDDAPRWLVEILSPTAAVWRGDAEVLQSCLHRAGFPVLLDLPKEREVAAKDAAALWLAGRLYQRLGRFLPLPAPLSNRALNALFAQLTPLQQAAVQAQQTALLEHLADLLDALPFTPPPSPTDPEQWRGRLETAIARRASLLLTYVSAGRNLTTRRRVEPHWIETRRGSLYLRAYCYNAGRVLTFRLDRILAIEEGEA